MKSRPVQYDATTDKVIYDSQSTVGFTHADWLRLAIAALDQAGCSKALQLAVGVAAGAESAAMTEKRAKALGEILT